MSTKEVTTSIRECFAENGISFTKENKDKIPGRIWTGLACAVSDSEKILAVAALSGFVRYSPPFMTARQTLAAVKKLSVLK